MERISDLGDLVLEKVVLEVRYPPAYLHWDRAGTLWSTALRKWPKLKCTNAEPAKTQFTLDSRFELLVELEKCAVIEYEPDRSLSAFSETARTFLELVTSQLDIVEYTRVGFRLQFLKTLQNRKQASDLMLRLDLLRVPEGPLFGIDGAAYLPEYSFRWEGEERGVTVRVRAEGRKLDFEPPLGVPHVKPVHAEIYGVSFDTDMYMIGSVKPGQLDAQEWIKQSLHALRKGSRVFFGG